MPAGDIAERQRRPERDAGSRIISVHDRSHVVAAGIEPRDPYDDVDAVFRTVSESRFGLQTGIFTASIALAIRAVRNLRTCGVIINDSSTWRTDQLGYGGVKDSGIGREGPRYSIRDMTEERMVLLNY